jgi:hypothetical protein
VGIWSRFVGRTTSIPIDLLHLSRRKKAERLSIGSREGEGKIVVAVDSDSLQAGASSMHR